MASRRYLETVGELLPPGNYEHLSYVLRDKGAISKVGKETGRKNKNGISVYRSLPFPDYLVRAGYMKGVGYVRLVGYYEGIPISGLLLINKGDGTAEIDTVFTAMLWRRQGLAEKLIKKARSIFKKVVHSDDLTPAGVRWSQSVGSLPLGF